MPRPMPSASPLPSLAPSNSPYKVAIKIRQRSADMGDQFEEHRPNTFSLNSNIHPFQPPKKCLSSVPSSFAEASGSPPPSLPPSPPIPRSTVRQRDVPVPAECSSAPSWGSEREQSWLDNPSAWDHFCSVLTSLYALFIIVFAVVVELSQKFTPDEWFSETLFYTYMYGAGIVFLMYCYLFKVHPNWISRLVKFARKKEIIRKSAVIVNRFEVSKTGQVRRGTGSLYLRLGTLCFGSSGIVLFCLEVFICFSDRACFNYQLVNWLFAGLFTFIQMHFIFCNSKLIIVDSKNSAKLGTMHLLAVNIWTWLRFVIAKNAVLDRPLDRRLLHILRQKRESLTSGESSEGMGQYQQHTQMLDVTYNPSASLERIVVNRLPSKVYSFNYFGDFATLLTTCIVEYSVIGAAVMVCLWRSIDEQNAKIEEKCSETMALKQHKNGKSVRIDCSASNGGLFAGLLFLIAALVSIGIHSFFSQLADSDGALLVFRLSDMALFCCTLIGCSVGLLRMRSLQYHCHEEQRSSSTEFLDEILLIIGLVGELIHSSTGVMCWIATLSDRRVPVKMELYMLFVFITRIVQVVVQAVFILLARRLCALSDRARKDKPGKQFVTFLLIANVSLFFFHTLEGMKSVFGSTITTRRARPYASLIVGVSPLVVFYRFHSSVCLAEIWKQCYSAKNVLPQQYGRSQSAELNADNANSIGQQYSTHQSSLTSCRSSSTAILNTNDEMDRLRQNALPLGDHHCPFTGKKVPNY